MSTVVELDWYRLGPLGELHDADRTFYALYHRREPSMLYIGKADYQTVGQRLRCRSKQAVWGHLLDECEFKERDIGLIAAMVYTDHRWTSELQTDVESLLIHRLRPIANIQALSSRVLRDGLEVRCAGAWPIRRRRFVDRW